MKTFKVGLCVHAVEIVAETEDEALEKFLEFESGQAQIRLGNYYPSVELVKNPGK